ncbi:peptide-methionine (S)-S-oxide reductase MsrA [Paenibacillus physcomitrellae]|uniref:Peptide methionine sulfoxide reductase MsrA n=1 Tax=Paenibacillus physcomitrellae TaxID=1619311 RepID=A0ABQ1GET8_9BACL|nr:peptide-methionine (S)-S-oxide reductase MsrA [Paenibacillus physcomitrellae]GGA42378.1 methionine-S-sulfoxide reductase [Paenibacillus physcomitrellae]
MSETSGDFQLEGKQPEKPDVKAHLETAVLGMGCFWSPEALFGQLPGVVRTRTGYAGGTAEAPTYRQMGDHTELVEIQFDPSILTYEQLLNLFWDQHNPVNINDYKGRQYLSLLLPRSEQQRKAISRVAEERKARGDSRPEGTEVADFEVFYPAEERHQKYYLARFPDALDKLRAEYPSMEALLDSTLSARLNGLAKGYTNLERIVSEIREWKLPAAEQERLIALIRSIRW